MTNIYQIRVKLTAIGENMNDQHLAALLLCSLPVNYDTLITILKARNEVKRTPNFIWEKLIDQFTKRQQNNNNTSIHSALKMKF